VSPVPNAHICVHACTTVTIACAARRVRCRGNHGVQTAYEFGEGIGGLEPCWCVGKGLRMRHATCGRDGCTHDGSLTFIIDASNRYFGYRKDLYHMDHFGGRCIRSH